MGTRVIVLGGGFSGVSAIKTLAAQRKQDISEILLINNKFRNCFSPLLPDLLSGRIKPGNITYPLSTFCHDNDVNFIHADVKEFIPEKTAVVTSKGTFEGDYVINCLGCVTNYFGNENYRKNAPGLKNVQDGSLIRRRSRTVLNKSLENENFKGHILLIGGGYTGFEAASQLANHLRTCYGGSFESLRDVVQFTIAELKPDVLNTVSPGVRGWAKRLIQQYGVTIRTEYTVDEFLGNGHVRMSDGTLLKDTLAIWTAGVKPRPHNIVLGTSKEAHGRVEVNNFLQVSKYPNFFAAGDVAGATLNDNKKPLRMSAQFSIAGGDMCARNILHDIRNEPLETFEPNDPGYIIPLAPGKAVSVVYGREFHGSIPFILHYLYMAS